MKLFLPGAGARMIPSLKSLPEVSEVVVSLHDGFAAGNFLADRSYRLPRFDDADFLPGVAAIQDLEHFDACIPVLDAALMAFARPDADSLKDRFALGMSPKAAIQIAADKMEVSRLFARCGLPAPETQPLPEFGADPGRRFPGFLKPRYAEVRDFGGGVYQRLDDQHDLDYWTRKLGPGALNHVVQPLLEGREINVNFFCDADGEVRSIVPIARLDGAPGRAMTRGAILEDARFEALVLRLAAGVRLWGSNELQVIVAEDDSLHCTEFNVRLNGGSHFLQASGVDHFANLLRLIRGEALRFPTKPRLIQMTSWETMHTFTESPLRETVAH